MTGHPLEGKGADGCADVGGCQEALAQLELFLDGELAEVSAETITAHLAECYPCGDRASFERDLRAVVRDRCAEDVPAGLLDRVRACLDGIGPVA